MSDFGSLLNQFQRDAKQLSSASRCRDRSDEDKSNEEVPARKRPRQVDAASFPPVKKVFLVCPAGVQTGGPEALHQLCDAINRSSTTSVRAFMLYVRSNGRVVTFASRAKKPIPYHHYDAPMVSSFDPLTENSSLDYLLIWPECWTDEMLDYLNSTPTPSPCAIWWLSVNNNTGKFQEWSRKDIIHLYQSEYARRYVTKNGASHLYRMTEYIPPMPTSSDNQRTIDVLYNPLKGMHYTDAICKRSGSLFQIRPIGGGPDGRERVSPEKVRSLLQSANIYVDFGPHPGMDRLPREAALAGCLVVTNQEGAARYEEDVPLPKRYKIQEFNVDAIHKLLVNLLENFDERQKDLDDYREWIQGQTGRMKECVADFLKEIVEKRAKDNE